MRVVELDLFCPLRCTSQGMSFNADENNVWRSHSISSVRLGSPEGKKSGLLPGRPLVRTLPWGRHDEGCWAASRKKGKRDRGKALG